MTIKRMYRNYRNMDNKTELYCPSAFVRRLIDF